MAASADGCWALAADKFGDVYVAPLQPDQPAGTSGAAAENIGRRVEPLAPSGIAEPNGQQTGGETSETQPMSAPPQAGPVTGDKAAVLLSHYNATITSLAVSADSGSLVSTDRDGKARVSVFPSRPLQVTSALCPG